MVRKPEDSGGGAEDEVDGAADGAVAVKVTVAVGVQRVGLIAHDFS